MQSSTATLCSFHQTSIQDYLATSLIPWRLEALCTPYLEHLSIRKTLCPISCMGPLILLTTFFYRSIRKAPCPYSHQLFSQFRVPSLITNKVAGSSNLEPGVPASPLWESPTS